MTELAICLLALLVAATLPGRRSMLRRLWRRARSRRARMRTEDALKHILAWQHRSQAATPESLAGALGLSAPAVLQLATRMEAEGWIETAPGGLVLTPQGERRALQVVRAHRIWERHLSDDANMPMGRLHQAAERAEHALAPKQVAMLDAHLGHPQHDPHGDPIPSADGRLAPLNAVGLSDWPADAPARVVHIEDEPHAIFRQILAVGLKLAQVVRVVESDARSILIDTEGARHRIDRVVANNIQVDAAREEDLRPPGAIRLAELARGQVAEVVDIGSECQGFTRRRLLDLGVTPGTRVEAALDNTFGDPRAYRIRGTTVAVRRQQADQVWVRHRP